MKKSVTRAAAPGSRKQPGGPRSALPVNRKKTALLLGVFTATIALGVVAVWNRLQNPEATSPYVQHPTGTLTFTKDIAPIVFSHCTVCHRPGQSSPFGLMSFADVKKRAKQITEVTQRRYMPPWLPEPGYGEFANQRRLSADQIGIIQQWVAEGLAEGNPADLPPAPRWSEGWQLGQPDLVVKMSEPYTLRPGGKDVYRNFVIPVPTTSTRYVQAVEFLPDNPKIVHHAFMKVDRTRESRRLDERDPEPGFDFMITPVSAQMPEGHFLSWVPGNALAREPNGLAWTLERDTDLVLQLHMRPSGKPEMIQPAVGIYFTDEPPTNTPFKILLTSRTIDIPAGVTRYEVEDSFILPVDVEVAAVLPHAHYLCRRMEAVAALPGGAQKWLLLIKEWDFNWQGDYRYAQPVFLPRGTTVSMRYTYDNSTNNVRNPHQPPERVAYGPQTSDEWPSFGCRCCHATGTI